MYVFLKVAPRLRRSDWGQVVDRGLQKFGNIFFDLLADARLFQRCQQFLVLNMGKSAAQRTFHDVIINHGSPSSLEIGHGKGRSSRLGAACPI